MKINIKSTNIDLPQTLSNYIYDKIGMLAKFLEKLEPKGVIEAWVEVGRTTKHHRKGPVYRAECDIRLPGRILRAEREDWDVRVAIDAIKDELQLEIKKYKEKAIDTSRQPRPDKI